MKPLFFPDDDRPRLFFPDDDRPCLFFPDDDRPPLFFPNNRLPLFFPDDDRPRPASSPMTAALLFFPASSLLLVARADSRALLLPRHLGVKQEVRPTSSPLLLLFLLQ
jgi:hypothetical protein